MSTLDVLLDAPAVPRVLRLLLDREGAEDETSVIGSLPDKTYAKRAIETLRAQGIIDEQDGVLRIVESEENSRRITGIMHFYSNVDTIARRNLLFRGILNTAQYACLVHIETLFAFMEDEGFTRSEVDQLIEKDSKEGIVERLKVMYRAREGVSHRCFPFIPLYYYPHFITMKSENTEHLRARLKTAGVFMIEEEYLLGHYPKEIANQARDYIIREKLHIRDKIKNESFDIWWYYRF